MMAPMDGMTQQDLNNRLIQNDDFFREKLEAMGKDIVEIKTTVGIHLDSEKKATNLKLSIFGLVIGAGSVVSVIFL